MDVELTLSVRSSGSCPPKLVRATLPAGTGKTLSLICSALQWLEDRREAEAAANAATAAAAAKTPEATGNGACSSAAPTCGAPDVIYSAGHATARTALLQRRSV